MFDTAGGVRIDFVGRVGRILLHCGTAVSFALCVTTAVCCVKSYSVTYEGRERQFGVRCDDGVIVLAAATVPGDDGGWHVNTGTKDHRLWHGIRYFYVRPAHGFLATGWTSPDGRAISRMLYVPWWAACLLTAVLPVRLVVLRVHGLLRA